MSLDENTVKKIAFLARIRVPDDALEPLSKELSDIIGWVEQLGEVETDGVGPMTSVAEMTWPRRDDVVNDGECPGDVLANATDPNLVSENSSNGGYFTVPKVVE